MELEVTATQAKELLAAGALLIDVREQVEWIAGHAPEATHIPLGFIPQAIANLPREEKVVVICRSGNRSMHAVMAMKEAGIDAVNLSGGMHAWQVAGFKVEAEGGEIGAVI